MYGTLKELAPGCTWGHPDPQEQQEVKADLFHGDRVPVIHLPLLSSKWWCLTLCPCDAGTGTREQGKQGAGRRYVCLYRQPLVQGQLSGTDPLVTHAIDTP